MPEHALLTGILEPTNEPYAIAKIAGIGSVKVIIVSTELITECNANKFIWHR